MANPEWSVKGPTFIWTTLLASALGPIGAAITLTALDIARHGQLELVFSLVGYLPLAVLFGFLPSLAGVVLVGWPTVYALRKLGRLSRPALVLAGAGWGSGVAIVLGLLGLADIGQYAIVWIIAATSAAVGMVLGLAGTWHELDSGRRTA